MYLNLIHFDYHILIVSMQLKNGIKTIFDISTYDNLCSINNLYQGNFLLNQEIDNIDYKICYYSCQENSFYYTRGQLKIPKDILKIAFAPYGIISFIGGNSKKTILARCSEAIEVDLSLKEISEIYRKQYVKVSKPISLVLFKQYAEQYCYRYLFLFKYPKNNEYHNDEAGGAIYELDYVEEVLYDGTHDKLHDGGLLKYHQAGKPKKLAIKWSIGKSEYSAYFWFEDERVHKVFDKFYGAHRNTKTDLIIGIDARNKKYELALFRCGLKEPQIIPESAYQLIIFKNKFEDYRSENYNQERGAWIW